MTEKYLQEKFVEYNIYKSELEVLAKELGTLNVTEHNLGIGKMTLSNVENLDEKPEILVPIGGNVFVKAKIVDTKNVLVGIGSDIVVKKEISNAIETIDKQLGDLKEAREKIEKQVYKLNEKMKALEPELEKMAKELRKKSAKKE